MVKITRKVTETQKKSESVEITPKITPSHMIVGTGTKVPKSSGGIVLRKKKF